MFKNKIVYFVFFMSLNFSIYGCSDSGSGEKNSSDSGQTTPGTPDTTVMKSWYDSIKVCTEFSPGRAKVKLDTFIYQQSSGRIDTSLQALAFVIPKRQESAAISSLVWDKKSLNVSFLDGDSLVIQKVIQVAKEWEQSCGIKFVFGKFTNPDISISFLYRGSWSCIGTFSKSNTPSMNLGWLTSTTDDQEYRRVVLHEFGHALGLIHEHQSPTSPLKWKYNVVYNYYMDPPNNWDKEKVDINIFFKFSKSEINGTLYDPNSIMIYAIPQEFLDSGNATKSNINLSDSDKVLIARIYPK